MLNLLTKSMCLDFVLELHSGVSLKVAVSYLSSSLCKGKILELAKTVTTFLKRKQERSAHATDFACKFSILGGTWFLIHSP